MTSKVDYQISLKILLFTLSRIKSVYVKFSFTLSLVYLYLNLYWIQIFNPTVKIWIQMILIPICSITFLGASIAQFRSAGNSYYKSMASTDEEQKKIFQRQGEWEFLTSLFCMTLCSFFFVWTVYIIIRWRCQSRLARR